MQLRMLVAKKEVFKHTRHLEMEWKKANTQKTHKSAQQMIASLLITSHNNGCHKTLDAPNVRIANCCVRFFCLFVCLTASCKNRKLLIKHFFSLSILHRLLYFAVLFWNINRITWNSLSMYAFFPLFTCVGSAISTCSDQLNFAIVTSFLCILFFLSVLQITTKTEHKTSILIKEITLLLISLFWYR